MSLTRLGSGTSLPDHAIAQRDAATLAASFANATRKHRSWPTPHKTSIC